MLHLLIILRVCFHECFSHSMYSTIFDIVILHCSHFGGCVTVAFSWFWLGFCSGRMWASFSRLLVIGKIYCLLGIVKWTDHFPLVLAAASLMVCHFIYFWCEPFWLDMYVANICISVACIFILLNSVLQWKEVLNFTVGNLIYQFFHDLCFLCPFKKYSTMKNSWRSYPKHLLSMDVWHFLLNLCTFGICFGIWCETKVILCYSML